MRTNHNNNNVMNDREGEEGLPRQCWRAEEEEEENTTGCATQRTELRCDWRTTTQGLTKDAAMLKNEKEAEEEGSCDDEDETEAEEEGEAWKKKVGCTKGF